MIASKISEISIRGSVLVVLPDAREVDQLHRDLNLRGVAHAVLSSAQSRAENYENFLRVLSGNSTIVVGTRSAIFAPLHFLACLSRHSAEQ